MKFKIEFARSKAHAGVVAILVDGSNPSGYPSNFICTFPVNLNMNSQFEKLFGEKSLELALRLLKEALENPEYRGNAELKAEIEERIVRFSPKDR
jgi:hypothetical protein